MPGGGMVTGRIEPCIKEWFARQNRQFIAEMFLLLLEFFG